MESWSASESAVNAEVMLPEFIHELATACALLADGRRKISLHVCASRYCSKFSKVSALAYLLYKFTAQVTIVSSFRECGNVCLL